MRRALTLLAIIATALVAGCGSDDSSGTTDEVATGTPAEAEILGASPADRKIGTEVQDYLLRNCAPPGTIRKLSEKERNSPFFRRYGNLLRGQEALCGQMASIEVENARVTIRSDIPPRWQHAAGIEFCNLVKGSDVADFTPGHELQELDGTTIEVCEGED